MLIGKLVLISSALLLALPPALAQEIRPADAPPDLFRAQPRDAASDDRAAAETAGNQDALMPSESRDGSATWHWALDNQSPSIEHRMSESGVMRFRGIRGGAAVVFRWGF